MTIDGEIVNPSDNRPFADILQARVSRRQALIGSLAAGAVGFFGASGVAQAAKGGQAGPNLPKPNDGALLGFTPSANAGGPNPTISPDYEWSVMIPWGSPLQPGGPDIDGGRPGSEAEALQQIGDGHDGMWYFPINGSSSHGVMCVNHEYGTNPAVLGKGAPESLEDVRISQAIHGVSVVEVAKSSDGTWAPVASSKSRRITPNTPAAVDGPAADSALLQTPSGNAPAGTVNNCGNGYTPWGTYLTCEENFNGYFGATGEFTPTAAQARYGFSSGGFGYGWHEYDGRWDLTNPAYTNEENRFGWIVEVDPMNPSAPPLKHTAMGRFKHEGVAFTTGRGGRAVCYMGDDQRFDYIYKYVSSSNWKSMRARGINPLSDGKLYVARFDEDGTGEWLELTIDNPAIAAEFSSQAEVLTYARLAADILGATPMDRPEWTSVAPNGDVYCTLTNNTARSEGNAANPLAPNPDGHIIRWRDSHNHVGTSFEWDIYVFAQDSRGNESWEFTDPDGLWCDADGRVFIQTDGGQPNGRNNQMLVGDGYTGEIRRLFAGIAGDEITGIAITPDRRTMFINTQHPGGNSQVPEVTNFPVPGAGGPEIPRAATIVITRKDGGIVGS